MSALLLERNPLAERVRSLTAQVERLQQEVCELRRENGEFQQEVCDLRREAGYWKSRHAGALERNAKLQAELDQARAEIRQLKAERFGQQSEKQSATDRSNDLDDPQQQAASSIQKETRATTGPPRAPAKR